MENTNLEKKVKTINKKIILSDKFLDALNYMQDNQVSNISKRLLELTTSDKLFDFSYVDIDNSGETVTYLQSNRIDRLNSEKKPISEFWTSKMRTSQKLARFIHQVLPSFSDDSITKFTDKLKSILKLNNGLVNFELVDGNYIIYWYNINNYESDKGTLGTSCMTDEESGAFLNCYRNNPNQCKLLILKSDIDKNTIKGRALIWKLNNPEGKIFMDKIYTNEDSDIQLFINYAKKNKWIYKSEQRYGVTTVVIPGSGTKKVNMDVILEDINYDLYPYVDTLRYFYPELKIMSNNTSHGDNYLILNDVSGHYEGWNNDDDDDSDPLVLDAYNNKKIPEHIAVWCEYDKGYIKNDDAIQLTYNGKYAFPNSPHIVFSDYTKKWYAKKDCDFSKTLNSWIWKKYSVDLYFDKDRKIPSDKIHRFELNKTIGKVNNNYYDIKILKVVSTKKTTNSKGQSVIEFSYDFKNV